MEHRITFRLLVCLCITALFGGLAATQSAMAQSPSKGSIVQMDRATFQEHLRAMGHKKGGSIAKSKTNHDNDGGDGRGLTTFNSSFTVGGVTYPYTQVGHQPRSGRSTHIPNIVVPLRMHFVGFGLNGDVNVDFDPTPAVVNIINSPIFQDASFPNGFGQFNDMMQRATFFNKMDREREWHVRWSQPKVFHTVDIEVTPETGVLQQVDATHFFGDVLFDFMDAEIRTIIELTGMDPDEVPIFVTDGVTNQALGYHSAFSVANGDGKELFQTFIFTSWLDPTLVDPLFADISTMNHESAELINDPFGNNVVPDWVYPPIGDPRAVCSGNPLLEVGDPEGNGPTFDDFPTVVIPLNGFNYHLQDLVMVPWFADEVPSSAQNGWYDYPATTDITAPAVYCP
ncbi:MAG TPA: hypothetical protein VEX69_08090 [Candidatus Limnocylindria bacterium]|nr:hypothetical protein [Candidatus Limnocylindria bacterium]